MAEVQRHQTAAEVVAVRQEEPGTAEEGHQPWEAQAVAEVQRHQTAAEVVAALQERVTAAEHLL